MRRSVPALVCAVLATACGGGGSPDAAPPGDPDAPPGAPTLDDALAAEGFTVQAGDAFAFGLADCADLPDCFASNATGSYVLFSVPPAPGAPPPPMGPAQVQPPRTPPGQSVAWQLAPHEAVLITGRTPPPARYFSVAPYLFERADGDARATIFASLADATNHLTLRAGGGSPFGAEVALVVAADGAVRAKAEAALVAAGWDPAAVNPVVVSPGLARLGLEPDDDTVMALGRVALFDDPAAGAAYLADVPLEVRRLTAAPAVADQPLPAPPRTAPAGGLDEAPLQPAVDALGAAIRATLAPGSYGELPVVSAALVGLRIAPATCISQLTDCLGEVSDTVYAAGPADVLLSDGTLTLGPTDRLIVYGVNHEASGLATYANVVVNLWSKRAGVATFESPDMPGSADAYLPDHPDRGSLFVVEIARACGGRPHCLELSESFPGVPADETLALLFRAYLQPGSTVAPPAAALVTERVLRVTGG